MSATIQHLPYDVVDSVASYLDIKDYQSFSWTSKRFYRDLRHDGALKKCLQSRLPFSRAADKVKELHSSQDGEIGRCFDIHHCRSEAMRTASPYSVTLLAKAASFVYDDGILCYVTRGLHTAEIRVLDLSQAAQTEKVISSDFLHQQIADLGGRTTSGSSSIAVLGFRMSIVTVLYDAGPHNGSYLFAIDTSDGMDRRTLVRIRLRSTHKLFVRHNYRYLYYGTHSATGSRDFREWLIQGHDLRTGEALTTEPIQLQGFSGSDLHSVVDFKIFKDDFYAITNLTAFECEEINWTSYYCYIRFPLESGGSKEGDLQLRTIWRRQDIDGPINDTYTHLSLQIDEATEELMLVEVRKEWPRGGSTSYRTCYMQAFDKGLHGRSDDRPSVNPNDRLGRAVEKTDKPRYEENDLGRIGKYTHYEFGPGFKGERHEYTPTKTKWKTYAYSGHAFVELVVDEVEVPDSWRRKERMRLRIASRTARSPLEVADEAQIRDWYIKTGLRDDLVEDREETYLPSQIFKWPPPSGPQGVRILPDELEEMICPGGKAGNNVQAILGDEGIVYLVGADSDPYGQRSLIYLSFDPTFGFEGMKRLDGSLAKPRQGWQQQQQQQQQQQKISSIATHRKHSMQPDELEIPESPTKRQKLLSNTTTGAHQENSLASRPHSEDHDLIKPVASGLNIPSFTASVAHNKEQQQQQQQQGKDQQGQEFNVSDQSTGILNRHLYRTHATYRYLKQSWWLR